MAQIAYRGNLSSAIYPLTLSKSGRSVINAGVDQNFDRRVDPSGDTTKNVGIPQAIYLENAVPTYEGYQSIGLVPHTNAPPVSGGSQIVASIRLAAKTVGPPAVGTFFIIDFYGDGTVRSQVADQDIPAYTSAWNNVGLPGSYLVPNSAESLSWGSAQGKTYLLIKDASANGCTLYLVVNAGGVLTFTDVSGAITGVALTNANSICSAYNYLILVFPDKVYWSSLVNPIDFTASLVTGAGSESIGANLTFINFAYSASNGFYLFTRSNVVLAAYTGNRGYPWRFIPVTNSYSTINRLDVVSNTDNSDIFTKTTRGQIQHLQGQTAQTIMNDVTDYLERDLDIDTLTWATGLFTTAKATTGGSGGINATSLKLETRIWYVNERYVVISYNRVLGIYQDAYLFDTVLMRAGKIKTPHTHVHDNGVSFSFYNILTSGSFSASRVSYDIHEVWSGSTTHTGIIVLGNFKTLRNNITTVETIEVESSSDTQIAGTKLFEAKFMGTTDEVNFADVAVPYTALQTRNAIKYLLHKSASSFRVGFRGQFKLAFVGFKFHINGHEL